MQSGSITRAFATVLALALGFTAAPVAEDVGWRDAPAFLDLFTPAAERQAYRTATSPADLDTVLRALADDASVVRTPDAWTPRTQSILDAVGKSGAYDRWTLARLFGAHQVRVARGAKMVNGRVTESWTLISPYPDPRFAQIEPGTLLIVLRLR